MLLGERLRTKARECMNNENLPTRNDRLKALRGFFPEITIIGKGGEQIIILDPEDPGMVISYVHNRLSSPRHLAVHLMTYHLHKIAQTMAKGMICNIQYIDTKEMRLKRPFIDGEECTNYSQFDHITSRLEEIYSKTGKVLPMIDHYPGNFIIDSKNKVTYVDKLLSHGNILDLKEENFDPRVKNHLRRLKELYVVEMLLYLIHHNSIADISKHQDLNRFDDKAKLRIIIQTWALRDVYLKYHKNS